MGVKNGVAAGSGVCRACVGHLNRIDDRRPTARAVVTLIFTAAIVGGCQGARPIEHQRLIEHQALIDFSGLKTADYIQSLKLSAALPHSWNPLPPQNSPLYTHTQWRAPSTHTGVGAAYVHLPLPVSAGAVLWLARQQYSQKSDDGRLIAQWKDELGREWFEAENNKYHVRGFALAQGFDAWVVYFGYRTHAPPNLAEIALAARCVDTFMPSTTGSPPLRKATTEPTTPPALAGNFSRK